jgi:hypothetical protein
MIWKSMPSDAIRDGNRFSQVILRKTKGWSGTRIVPLSSV